MVQQRKGDVHGQIRSRSVSFNDECGQMSSLAERSRSVDGQGYALQLMSPRSTLGGDGSSPSLHYCTNEKSFGATAAKQLRSMLKAGSYAELRMLRMSQESCGKASAVDCSGGGAESDAFSGCWSDDSAEPNSRMRKPLSQQRRLRLHLKQQRSAGGSGCGYESADEPISYGGAYSESADEQFEEPGRYTVSHLTHLSGRALGTDRSHASGLRGSHKAMLHSAPLPSLHLSPSR